MVKTLLSLLICTVGSSALAQQISKADYQRAVASLWSNFNNKKVFNYNPQPIWAQDSSGMLFVSQSRSGRTYFKVDWRSKKN